MANIASHEGVKDNTDESKFDEGKVKEESENKGYSFDLDVPNNLRKKLSECNEIRIEQTQTLKEEKEKKERLKVEKKQLKEKINQELENQDITVLETKIDNIQDLSEIETFKTILDNLKEIEELIVQFKQYTDYVDNLDINQDLVNQITWDNSENIEKFLGRTVDRIDILNEYLGQASMEKLDRQKREEAAERESQEAEERQAEQKRQASLEEKRTDEEEYKEKERLAEIKRAEEEKERLAEIKRAEEKEERKKRERDKRLEQEEKKKWLEEEKEDQQKEKEYSILIEDIKINDEKQEYFENFIKKHSYESIQEFENDKNVYHKIEILHTFDAVFEHLIKSSDLEFNIQKKQIKYDRLSKKLNERAEEYFNDLKTLKEAKEKLEDELHKSEGKNEEQIKKSKEELEKVKKDLKTARAEISKIKKDQDKIDTERKNKEDEEEKKKAIKKILEKIKASENWKNGTWIEKSIFSERQIKFLKEKEEELRLGHVLYLKYSQIRKINQEYIRMGKGLDDDIKGGFGTEQKPKEESSDKIDDDKIEKNINEFFKEQLKYIFDPKEIVQQLSLKEYFEFLKGQY